jgi:CheY-like chemotaxis protein
VVLRTHNRIVPARHAAYFSAGCHFPQPVEWEPYVRVLLERATVEVGADMRYDNVGEYDLDGYEGGAAALAGMSESAPDLVLLDISLPALDGTELLRRARAGPLAH